MNSYLTCDEQIEGYIKAGKLDGLANQAVAYYQKNGEWVEIGLDKELTDLERFVELYKSFGIKCVVKKARQSEDNFLPKGTHYAIYLRPYDKERNRKDSIHTDSRLFDGIVYCYSDIAFSESGKFLGQVFGEENSDWQ